MVPAIIKQKTSSLYILLRGKERLLVWQKVRGIWKSRKPDPIKELSKIRKEWERTVK